MKKVLYVCLNRNMGASEKFLINIAGMHKETNDNVHFLLFNNGLLENEFKNMGMTYTVLKTKISLTNLSSIFSGVVEIRTFLKRYKFDILHSSCGFVHFIIGLSTIFKNVNRVWFQHGPVGTVIDYLASMFKVDVILFSSHFLMEKHYSKFFLRKGSYGRKIIPQPLEIKNIKLLEAFALKKSLNLEGKYVIGMVGRITKLKGFDLAIQAFLDLDLEDARLIIVGRAIDQNDINYCNELKNKVAKSKSPNSVQFIEGDVNIYVYYKMMDLYLNPSEQDEGFGLSVAEAMASGVPVISSAYGGLSEFVKENETAEVILSRSSDAKENLKLQITKLKNDEILSRKLSKNALDLIESRFSFSHTYVAITDVYQFLNSIA